MHHGVVPTGANCFTMTPNDDTEPGPAGPVKLNLSGLRGRFEGFLLAIPSGSAC
jgi:hypothetical protein